MLHIVDITKQKIGFTLIELVLSLGLLGLIITTTFTLYGIGMKTLEHEDNRLFLLQNTRQAVLWLSTSIKQAKNVHVISSRKIETTTSRGEIITYYFENGILYRRKNAGTNPIAELSDLRFYQPEGKSFIEIVFSSNSNAKDMEIRTKATPLGAWIY
ncbi:MAG TPA: prepilin-type cleavage/methylation domain-containing protein [Thermoanaerobacterales bacterium]|nr:prepilin-type cleavage/methylation domain-containing protein [Thermoanaerobacterales bacterium]